MLKETSPRSALCPHYLLCPLHHLHNMNEVDKPWHRNRPVSGPLLGWVAASTVLATGTFYKSLTTSYFPHGTPKSIPQTETLGDFLKYTEHPVS